MSATSQGLELILILFALLGLAVCLLLLVTIAQGGVLYFYDRTYIRLLMRWKRWRFNRSYSRW
jgi:hypothetical protein